MSKEEKMKGYFVQYSCVYCRNTKVMVLGDKPREYYCKHLAGLFTRTSTDEVLIGVRTHEEIKFLG